MTKLILALLLSFAGTAFVCAQDKENPEAEKYRLGLQEARNKTELSPRRIFRVIKRLTKAPAFSTCNETEEIISPKISRIVRKSEPNDKDCDSELVIINESRYTKMGSEAWVKTEVKEMRLDRLTKLGSSDGGPPKTVREYVVTKAQLDGVQATVYFNYEVLEFNGLLTFTLNRDWVNLDGLIIKSERKSSSVVPEYVTYSVDTKYEYDPKIKIEAPIK